MTKSADALDITRPDAHRRRHVRRERGRAGGQERGECDITLVTGNTVDDARTDSRLEVNRQSPPK